MEEGCKRRKEGERAVEGRKENENKKRRKSGEGGREGGTHFLSSFKESLSGT